MVPDPGIRLPVFSNMIKSCSVAHISGKGFVCLFVLFMFYLSFLCHHKTGWSDGVIDTCLKHFIGNDCFYFQTPGIHFTNSQWSHSQNDQSIIIRIWAKIIFTRFQSCVHKVEPFMKRAPGDGCYTTLLCLWNMVIIDSGMDSTPIQHKTLF